MKSPSFSALITAFGPFCLLLSTLQVSHAQFFQSKIEVPFATNQFRSVAYTAVDGSNNVYIVDEIDNRVKKFSSNGTPILQWGTYGAGVGQFDNPAGIAISSAGDVYVADSYNHRIHKFTSTGVHVLTWGSYGSAEGQFLYPKGVAVAANGDVYVCDQNNSRIQKFNSSGVPKGIIGAYGNQAGQLNYPTGIAVDGDGNLYVADTNNNRVVKFSSSGTSISSFEGQFNRPVGIAVDGSGNIIVSVNFTVRVINSSGTFLRDITPSGSYSYRPFGIGIDSNGNLYIPDTNNFRLIKYSIAGNLLATWNSTAQTNGQFGYPGGVAVDPAGNIYVVDLLHNEIEKFSSANSFITKWGSRGNGNSQFSGPTAIATDASGNVYVVDSDNQRVQKFTGTGTYITQWGGYGSGNGQFYYPQGIAIDGNGNVFVSERFNQRIQKFSANGTFIKAWGSGGNGNGQFNNPQGIAVDGAGNVFVVDQTNQRIQKFTNTGEYISKWGQFGTSNGQFTYPSGIAIDNSGDVFVSDQNGKIRRFKNSGEFVFSWGGAGSGDGLFHYPTGIAASAAGEIFVADQSNHRIQKFSVLNIKSISAVGGAENASITIGGTGFGVSNPENTVKLNDVTCNITASNSNSITFTVPPSATTGFVSVTRGGYTSNSSFEFLALPLSITNFTPLIGANGGQISITGTGFSSINTSNLIKISGVAATVTESSPTLIKATLPIVPTQGKITLTINGVTATSATDFFGTLSITSVAPTSALPGAPVTIKGTNFSNTNNLVDFNGTPAPIISQTSTTITIAVPTGATTGLVGVTREGLRTESPTEFVVLPLEITSFSPGIGGQGTQVTITGTGFSTVNENNKVKINGVIAGVTNSTPTSITIFVPEGNPAGKITLSVHGLTATSTDDFGGILKIDTFSPPKGIAGTAITIIGSGFSPHIDYQIVKFNGAQAVISSSTLTTLVVTVPEGSTTGTITVSRENSTVKTESEFLALPLSINSFSPSIRTYGSTVVIMGTGFSGIKENNIVKINGLPAKVEESSSTTIRAVVPADVTNGKISVTVAGTTATSSADLAITKLEIKQQNAAEFLDSDQTSAYTGIEVNDVKEVKSIQLKYYGITEGESVTKVIDAGFKISNESNIIDISIPASSFSDPIGIRHWYSLTDQDNNEIVDSTRGIYLNHLYGSAGQIIPGLLFGKSITSYQMIAIPLELSARGPSFVFADLGAPDKRKWRLFEFVTSTPKEPTNINSGRGYWFIMRDDHQINAGKGHTVKVTQEKPYTVNLTKGLNFIGNPYNFTISCEDIVKENKLPEGSLKFRQYINGRFENQDLLKRYRAAYIYSDETITDLKIPVISHGDAGRKNESTAPLPPINAKYWEVELSVDDGTFYNDLIGLGMNPKAKEQKDIWDEVALPLIDGMSTFDIVFRELNDDITLIKDVIPTQDTYTWQASISSDHGVTINWNNDYFGDNNKQLIFENASEVDIVDMRKSTKAIVPAGDHILRFHYGDETYIKKQLKESTTRIGSVFPNPVHRGENLLSVFVSLPDGTNQVAFELKDVLGGRASLSGGGVYNGGRKAIELQEDFSQLSSGVYLLRLEIKDAHGVTSILHKKVIFE